MLHGLLGSSLVRIQQTHVNFCFLAKGSVFNTRFGYVIVFPIFSQSFRVAQNPIFFSQPYIGLSSNQRTAVQL